MSKGLFKFDGQEVRTIVDKEGEPLFNLSDVCKILEIGNPTDVKNRLEDGVVSIEVIKDRLNRNQKATFVNEDGLYDVIFDSRKEEARQFRKWVTSQVLPTIRKEGGYISSNISDEQADKLDKKLLLSTPQRRRKALEDATIDGRENVFTVYDDIKEYVKNQSADEKVKRLRHVEKVLDDKKKNYGTDIAFVVKIEELLVTVAKDIDKIRNHSYGARLREMNKQHKELQDEIETIKPPAIEDYYVINYHPFSINSSYEAKISDNGKPYLTDTPAFKKWKRNFPYGWTMPSKKEMNVDFNKPIRIHFYYDHLEKFDLTNFNFDKSAQDMIFKYYQADDQMVWETGTAKTNRHVGSYDEGKIYFYLENINKDEKVIKHVVPVQ